MFDIMIYLDFLEIFPESFETFFSSLHLKNHFGDISCLTMFGIVVLAHSELHRSGSSFMSQSHVTCHTNVITKMVYLALLVTTTSFPYFYLILSRAISLSIFAYVKVLPIPSYLSILVGMYPLSSYHSLTIYLILSYLPSYPDPKSGGKQGLCAGCPPLYTLASPSGGNPRND